MTRYHDEEITHNIKPHASCADNQMDLNKDYYAILGIIPSADKETIKAVYRLLSKKYHPDTTKEDSDEISVTGHLGVSLLE